MYIGYTECSTELAEIDDTVVKSSKLNVSFIIYIYCGTLGIITITVIH